MDINPVNRIILLTSMWNSIHVELVFNYCEMNKMISSSHCELYSHIPTTSNEDFSRQRFELCKTPHWVTCEKPGVSDNHQINRCWWFTLLLALLPLVASTESCSSPSNATQTTCQEFVCDSHGPSWWSMFGLITSPSGMKGCFHCWVWITSQWLHQKQLTLVSVSPSTSIPDVQLQNNVSGICFCRCLLWYCDRAKWPVWILSLFKRSSVREIGPISRPPGWEPSIGWW